MTKLWVFTIVALLQLVGVWTTIAAAAMGDLEGKCPTRCTREYLPVCGSNGVTYANKCLLKVAQCENPAIHKKHSGLCIRQ